MDTPLGTIGIAELDKRICLIEFLEKTDEWETEWPHLIQKRWPLASTLHVNTRKSHGLEWNTAARTWDENFSPKLLLIGTPFQCKVWEALLAIPPGQVESYAQIAKTIGRPQAARAVGQAIGANPIAWLVPCHRVIRSDGELGGYYWNTSRKKQLLELERCEKSRTDHPVCLNSAEAVK